MPRRKLPKGAQSIGDVARQRGTGGSILREYRRAHPKGYSIESALSEGLDPLEPTRRGRRTGARALQAETVSQRQGRKFLRRHERTRSALREHELRKKPRLSLGQRAKLIGRVAGKLSAVGLIFEAARMSEEMSRAQRGRRTGRLEM
jgi:hypothetical protein